MIPRSAPGGNRKAPVCDAGAVLSRIREKIRERYYFTIEREEKASLLLMKK